MNKIILRTSGLPLGGRKREPDVDHATQILDLVMNRGYQVNASDDGATWFSYSFIRFPDNSFSNQPEGTTEVMRMFLNYGTDNAALYDHTPPDWCAKLERLIFAVKPPTLYITRNMSVAHIGDDND